MRKKHLRLGRPSQSRKMKKEKQKVSAKSAGKNQEKDFTPLEFSRSEVLILQELSKRRKVLDLREQQINRREGLLQAAELKLVTKQGELKKIREDIKSLLGTVDEKEKSRLRNLVKIYESMKPKDAARIFNELDMTVLMGVVAKMSVRKVAMIISAMEVKKARAVTRELAEQKTIVIASMIKHFLTLCMRCPFAWCGIELINLLEVRQAWKLI